jgi:hypothetical protein
VGWNPTIQEGNTVVFTIPASSWQFFKIIIIFHFGSRSKSKRIDEIPALSKDLAMLTSEMTCTLGSTKV